MCFPFDLSSSLVSKKESPMNSRAKFTYIRCSIRLSLDFGKTSVNKEWSIVWLWASFSHNLMPHWAWACHAILKDFEERVSQMRRAQLDTKKEICIFDVYKMFKITSWFSYDLELEGNFWQIYSTERNLLFNKMFEMAKWCELKDCFFMGLPRCIACIGVFIPKLSVHFLITIL